MKRGFKCKEKIIKELKSKCDETVAGVYHGNFLEAIKAWKSCKGELYEYVVFRYIENIIEGDDLLKDKIMIMRGDETLVFYKEELSIRNWKEIFPDVDIAMIKKDTKSIHLSTCIGLCFYNRS